MTVGMTIYSQLKATSRREMMCWGFSQPMDMGDGLKFKVTGLKFRGYVYVKYDEGSDLYIVQLATVRKQEWKVKLEVKDIFCDELGTTIDSLVEM